MTGLGIGIITAMYSIGLWGYMLVRGYDVTFPQLWTKLPPHWPPDKMPPNEIYPHTGAGNTPADSGNTTHIVPLQNGLPQGGRANQFGGGPNGMGPAV